MKVKELLALLHDIPLEAEIYVDNQGETFTEIAVEPITESHDVPIVIGYLICDKKQLEFDFEEK